MTAGGFVFEREHGRGPNVQGHAHQQPDAHNPQHRPELVQKMGITIDVVGMQENLQVADQMAGDETNENEAGRGHQELSSDGGAK
jgi:hypothetical protein